MKNDLKDKVIEVISVFRVTLFNDDVFIMLIINEFIVGLCFM